MNTARRAFTLVEVTLAMGIAAVALVVVIGMLPVGLSTNKASTEQTNAAGILADLATSLRAAPVIQYQATCPIYPLYMQDSAGNQSISTIYLHEDGTQAPSLAGGAADPSTNPYYRVTIRWYGAPAAGGTGTTPQRTANVVALTITWPALGEINNYVPPPKYANMLELVTTLDRN